MAKIAPVHPGDLLWEEFMQPLSISQNALGRALQVSASRIKALVKRQRGVTADTALRLARYFGTTPQFWMNLQMRYELERQQDVLGKQLETEILPLASGET